jgi:3-deoxy-manno-octulosonate cytidylyltransferase (CMP-KDO synthetase)
MQVVAIIPARFGSTRFPGKPLANQTGKFLIQHVYEQVIAARRVNRCIVATDDERIVEAVGSFGGEAVMTRTDHACGTDRIAEVVRELDGTPEDVILNVQGDEPELEPEHLDRVIAHLAADGDCRVATLACPFPPDADPRDPNCVKVVCSRQGRALYFSRALVPWLREQDPAAEDYDWLLHLGVYAFRRGFLLDFASWEAGPLERIERLEQLRVLEYGYAMAVTVVSHACAGVDTPEDYEKFVARHEARV